MKESLDYIREISKLRAQNMELHILLNEVKSVCHDVGTDKVYRINKILNGVL